MRLKFTKMHGLGNDFMVFDGINQCVELCSKQIQDLANRRFGVGFDQLLLVEKPDGDEADFKYRIYNANGGEVEQCGNGVRCFARFVVEKGLSQKNRIVVETLGGTVIPELVEGGHVRVDMGVPNFDPAALPFTAEQAALAHNLDVEGEVLSIGAVSMGNPHAVLQVPNIQMADVVRLGPLIEGHVCFPRNVNAGFMQVVDRGRIKLRVYERGAGETMACGTGACAAVAVARTQDLVDERVVVELSGGELIIEWAGMGQRLYMTGDASNVFEGEIEI
jgi:diaminopimelate epimerase